MTPGDYSPERLADRAQIQDTLHRWCRAVDRLDAEGMRSVFHPDGIDLHGAYDGGVEGMVAWIMGRHAGIPVSMHSITNVLVEFVDADVATAESYCTAVQRLAEPGGAAGPIVIASVRYLDRFERREGAWRVRHRTVVYDSLAKLAVSADSPKMGEGWIVGARDRTDALYGMLRTGGS